MAIHYSNYVEYLRHAHQIQATSPHSPLPTPRSPLPASSFRLLASRSPLPKIQYSICFFLLRFVKPLPDGFILRKGFFYFAIEILTQIPNNTELWILSLKIL